MSRKTLALFDPTLVKPAIVDSFKKLDPRLQWRNPVMFVVYVGSILTTVLWAQALGGHGEAPAGFILAIALWLWFTVLFANFAEALAEGRSKAQAASLRGAKKTVMAKKLREPRYGAPLDLLPGTELRRGDVVLVEAGDMIPADGEVIEGVASVNESAITGESAPVIRESGGDFSAVTGGTTVLSDWIVVRVSVNPGEAFIDRMIAMVEGRETPENAQRDRAHHPAGGADHYLPWRNRDPAAVLAVQRERGESRRAGDDHRTRRAVGVPDPHHDCGIAIGHRRGRHEPDDAGQRDRHLGPGRGGGGRRRCAVAGQNRHHHPRQSAGDGRFCRQAASRKRN
ncbi:MAG: hypothetical protein V9G98_12265 [Candidatus Competibacter sp.]